MAPRIEDLEQAITAMERQRETLGDTVVDAALASMNEKLVQLKTDTSRTEHQRKLLTVLFTDIVASTQLGRERDPEEILEIMDSALQQLAAPVGKYGGHVTRYMGDGFKAVFGLPVAHENDAELAIRAGLEIQAATRVIAEQLEQDHDTSGFSVRIGISTGMVATGGFSEAEDTVMGLTVNLAARMEQAAPPGGLLISHHTYRHVRGVFGLDPVDPVLAKGFDDPVRAYLVKRAKTRPFYIPTRSVTGQETRLYGRDAEFELLKTLYLTAHDQSKAQFITIVGDPGIGKSRLLYELTNWIDLRPELIRYFRGRATQQTIAIPFGLLRDMITYRFEILENDPTAVALQKLEGGIAEFIDEEPQMKAHFIGAMLGLEIPDSPYLIGIQDDREQLRERSLFYLVEYLCALAKARPAAVLFLEDVHYADTPSLDAISHIASQCAHMRLMIICSARPQLYNRHPHWDQSQEPGGAAYTRIDLQPLDYQTSERLAGEILNQLEHVPEKLLDTIATTAEGNPFYIEELVRMLIDDGIIQIPNNGERWHLNSSKLPTLHIPPTLTALLQARLDSLPAADRAIIQQAAVVGRIFWDESLPTGVASENKMPSSLQGLAVRELIFRRKSSSFRGVREYIFKSSLMCDVVYQTVPLRQRRQYHAHAADWLVAATEENRRVGEYAAVIASHYGQAGQKVPAADWYTRAGERALAQGTAREARMLFDTGIENIPQDDLPRRWQALLGRIDALTMIGDKHALQEDDDALLRTAQMLNNDANLAKAHYYIGYHAYSMGDDVQAVEAYQASLSAALRAGEVNLQAHVLTLMVVSQARLGQQAAAAQRAAEVLAMVNQITDEPLLARVLTNLAIYFGATGDLSRKIELYEELVDITDKLEERRGQMIVLSNLGYTYLLLGDIESGIATLGKAYTAAERIGADHQIAYVRLNLGLAHELKGDHDHALEMLEQVLEDFQRIEDKYGIAVSHNYLGRVAESINDTATAQGHYTRTKETAETLGMVGPSLDACAGLARSHMADNDIDQSASLAQTLWSHLQTNGGTGLEFPILAYLTAADVHETIEDAATAKVIIDTGRLELHERAEKISDPALKRSYLENVPEHRAIRARWGEYSTI